MGEPTRSGALTARRSISSAKGTLMAVDVSTTGRFTAGVPRQLFRTAGRNMRTGYAHGPTASGFSCRGSICRMCRLQWC